MKENGGKNVPLVTKSRKIEGHQNPLSFHIKCPTRSGIDNKKKTALVHNITIDMTYHWSRGNKMGKVENLFMFRKYDMIKAFDAGSYSYIFLCIKR